MSGKRRSGRTRTILILAAFFLLAANISQARYSGGTGEPNNPYRIETPNDLNDIGNHVEDFNKCFVMVNDINLADYTGTQFNIIGRFVNPSDPNNKPFMGIFDGNGHSILNFSYEDEGGVKIGLFSYLDDPNAQIKDLTLIDASVKAGTGSYVGGLVGHFGDGTVSGCEIRGGRVSGRMKVGALVGHKMYGTISNCRSTGHVSGTDYQIGGLVGFNWSGVILDCYAAGTVNGKSSVGGLAGHNHFGTISQCFATGPVSASGYQSMDTGGLIGHNRGTISNCYSKGFVVGEASTGGLLGFNLGTVSDSFAAGMVDGNEGYAGGLVGNDYYFSGGIYVKCFWDSDINPDVNGIGNGSDPNVIGKTTAEMQTESTFTNAGWDFVGETANGTNEIWRMCVDGVSYPLLSWQFGTGDFVCPDGVNFVDYAFFANHWGGRELQRCE
ncbi:MAG: GLUG motif-containing protein [Planctomycetota bacterium]